MKIPPGSLLALVFSFTACAASFSSHAALIGYYAFEEGSGTATEDDSIGTDADGILKNGATFGAPSPAPGSTFSAEFDGTNDFIDLGNPTKYQNLTGAMTLSAWVYVDSYTASGRIVTKGGNGTNRGWSLNIEFNGGGAPEASFQIATSASVLATVETLPLNPMPTGTWYHLAGVFTPDSVADANSDGTLAIYVNGVLANSKTTSAGSQHNSTANVAIGARSDGTVPFDGRIDDVRIYDQALSAADIAALAVPEPGAGALLFLALGTLALRRSRRDAH